MRPRSLHHCLLLLILLLAGYCSCVAQCDASFTYQAEGATTFKFTANQVEQPGFTYYQKWTCSNGVTNNGATVEFYFGTPGTYQVCHSVTIQDSFGTTLCSDSSCQVIQINTAPSCFPSLTVQFQSIDSVTGIFTNSLADYTNVAIKWVFGDGTTVTGIASPTHTYPHTGQYEACLQLIDTVRHCGDTVCQYVYLYSPITYPCTLRTTLTAIQPSFSSDTVFFTDSTTGAYQKTIWNFGDGTTDSFPVASHAYAQYGVFYNACVTQVDTAITGCSYTSCSNIYLDSCISNSAQFTTQPQYNNLDITFEGNVSNYALYNSNPFWIWTFGDNSIDTINAYASHAYTAPGRYLVCLTVHAPGCPQESYCDTVQVDCQLSASFGYQQVSPLGVSYNPNSNSTSVVYFWLFGDSSVSNETYPTHVFQHIGTYQTCLIAFDTIGGCRDTTCISVTITSWTDTICGYAFVDLNGNGIWDTQEPPVVGAPVLLDAGGYQFQVTTDTTGFYLATLPAYAGCGVTFGYTGAYVNTLPFLVNYYYFSTQAANHRQCGYDFGIITSTATVAGVVYADTNLNGVYDAGEPGIPNQVVHINGQAVVTDMYGNYNAVTGLNPTTIWKDSSGFLGGFTNVPAQLNISPVTPGALYGNNNIGVEMPGNYNDLAVDLVPLTPVDVSIDAQYQYIVASLSPGYSYYAGSLTSDPSFTLYSGDYYSYNSGTNTAFWSGPLSPFEIKLSDMYYIVSPVVTINQDIYNTAEVNLVSGTDQNLLNNYDTCHQIVVASFDPNGKISNQAGQGAQGYISNNQELKYVIRFENTGTAAAVNIVVTDVLDPSLDPSPFRFVSSSSHCDVRLLGDTLFFRFSDIMLPSGNPPGQGWLCFSIKPKPGLAPFTQIKNNASVYFDLNSPIITNTTLHTIQGPNAIQDISASVGLSIIPNPFNQQTTIRINDPTGATYQYKITDMMGRTVRYDEIVSNTSTVLPRQELSSGTYAIVFYSGATVIRAKVVIQ